MTSRDATWRGSPSNATLKNAIASLVPMGTTFVATTLLARGTDPSNFGVWAFFSTSVALIQALDLGINATLTNRALLAESLHEVVRWLRVALIADLALALIVVAVLSGAVMAGARSVVPWAPGSHKASILICVSVLLLSTLWANCATAAIRAVGNFSAVLVSICVGQAAYLAGFIALAATHHLSVSSALVVQALSLSLTLAFTLVVLRFWDGPNELNFLTAASSVRVFARRVWGTNISGAVVSYAPTIVCAPLLGSHTFGVFALGSSLALALRAMPLVLVAPLQRKLASAVGHVSEVRSIDRRWTLGLAIYAPFACVGVVILCHVIGGSRYAAAAWPALLLVMGHMMALTTAICTVERRLKGSPRRETLLSAFAAVLFIGMIVPLTNELGASGPGVALIVSQAVFSILMRWGWNSTLRQEVRVEAA